MARDRVIASQSGALIGSGCSSSGNSFESQKRNEMGFKGTRSCSLLKRIFRPASARTTAIIEPGRLFTEFCWMTVAFSRITVNSWVAVIALGFLFQTSLASFPSICTPLPCGPGYGVNSNCGGKCAPCILGSTYSSLNDNIHVACQPVTDPAVIICQRHARIVLATPDQDTKCQCEENYFRNPTTDRCIHVPVAVIPTPTLATPADVSLTPATAPANRSEAPSSKDTDWFSIFACLGGAVVVIALLAIIFVWRSRQRRTPEASNKTDDDEKNTKTDDDEKSTKTDDDEKNTKADDDKRNTEIDDDKKNTESDDDKAACNKVLLSHAVSDERDKLVAQYINKQLVS